MAVHDPDSAVRENKLALKLGRQKKIQMIDGQQVEVMPGMDSEDEEDDEMMAVEGSDGQQYVVLEVIQLADGDQEQTVTMVGDGEDGGLLSEHMLPDNDMGEFLCFSSHFCNICTLLSS